MLWIVVDCILVSNVAPGWRRPEAGAAAGEVAEDVPQLVGHLNVIASFLRCRKGKVDRTTGPSDWLLHSQADTSVSVLIGIWKIWQSGWSIPATPTLLWRNC
jgi:hypothetical protein